MKNRRTFLKQVGMLTVLTPLAAVGSAGPRPLVPQAQAIPTPQPVPLVKDGEPLGFKPHPIRQGDGKGGWTVRWGEVQLLRHGADINTNRMCPFGLAQMDNGEVAFMGIVGHSSKREQPVISFSRDGGNTWSELNPIDD